MIFKRNVGLIFCFFGLTALLSCSPSGQKNEDAFDSVKKERMQVKDSDSLLKDSLQAARKSALAKKNEVQDPWTVFKHETERKIRNNENLIKEIKGLPDTDAGLFRRIRKLEKDNLALRTKMNDYKAAMQQKWADFQASLNKEESVITNELKDIKSNSTK